MRWFRALFLLLSLLILVAAALVVPLPLYLEQPGQVVPLAACVEVDDPDATEVSGDYLLMTISVAPATAVGTLVAAFDDDTAVVARRAVVPSGVTTDRFFADQRKLFATTRDIAAAVGLQRAGIPARVTGDGVSVVQVAPDSPAAAALEPGDVITAINGNAITNEGSLREAIEAAAPGQALTVEVTRRAEEVSVQIEPVIVEGTPRLGVVPETVNPRVTLPVGVEVTSGAVGGPSAGLMIALTVYDKVLPGVDLSQGRIVAGTGTIDQSGAVGPVGGAGLKVIAAHRRGASVFLVPQANAEEARAAVPAGSALQIVAVTSFEDAQRALEAQAADADGAPSGRDRGCPYDRAP